jgi:uncharacterized protein (DUF2147 family)
MKKAIVALFLVMAAFQAQAQNSIEGIWLTEEGSSKIEIYQKGERYFGKVVWMEQPMDRKGNPITDRNNPDSNLRNRQLMGIDMLQNLQYQSGKWYGKLYAPKRGITTDVVIVAKEVDKLQVNISYQGFTRQQIWTRANSK